MQYTCLQCNMGEIMVDWQQMPHGAHVREDVLRRDKSEFVYAQPSGRLL